MTAPPVWACAPLLFAGDREAGFWLDGPGRDHVRDFLDLLAGLPGVNRLVVLTEPGRPAPPTDATVLEVTPDRQGLFPLPADRLLALFNALSPPPGTWLLWADVRHPAVTAERLAAVLDRCRQDAAPCFVSVREPEDHPCQFLRYYRVLDAGLVHMLQPSPQGAASVQTKPLPEADGDWASGMRLPVAAPTAERHPCGLFHADCSELPLTPTACDRVFLDAAGRLRLRFPPQDDPDACRVIVQPLVEAAAPLLAAFSPDGTPEVVFDLDPAALDGLVYTLLRIVPGGFHDLASPMPPIEGLWTVDEQGLSLRAVDGKQILGRQDFPPVFEATADLLAIPMARLPEAQALLDRGEAAAVVLPQPAITVASAKDATLAEILLELAERTREK